MGLYRGNKIINDENRKELVNDCRIKLDCISKVYTSESGNNEEFQNVNNIWYNKNIFCSPTVQYGLSYDIPESHHIFSFCYRNTASAFDNMQQANRIRHPKSYHIFVHSKKNTEVDDIDDSSDEDDCSNEMEKLEKDIMNIKAKNNF